MNNNELTFDQLTEISGGIVDFGGSQFKVSTTVREKGWWTVDGADFKSVAGRGFDVGPISRRGFDIKAIG